VKKENEKLVQTLLGFSLTEKEAEIYVAALELGRGTASEIARKAGISRTNSYNMLDALVTKGLIEISGKAPKHEYVAASPENLTAYVERQREEAQANAEKVRGFVSELKSIQKVGDRPKVTFYEGTEGLKRVYEDTLTSSETVRGYATYETLQGALKNYFPQYYKRRAAKGIFGRCITPDTPSARERILHNKEEARDIVRVPADKYTFIPEIDIYDNKVMIASWREKLGIIIESAEIADAMKKIFELAWERAKELDASAKTL
jgi:sugar-specific transcriptional regulator TrmB